MRMATRYLALGLVMIAGAAQGQTWQAATDLVVSSPSSCPKAEFVFELSLHGERFTIVNPAGKKFEAGVAPDGTVKLEYPGASRVGKVTISGNARTQQLELTGSALTGCRYALKPTADGPQQTYQWTAVVDLVHGAFRNCGDPPYKGRKIVIRGHAFTATPDNEDKWNDTSRLNLAALKPDGSGRITVNHATTGARWHFDFEAGQGPRTIIVSGDTLECKYGWKPL
jgi:hypothetical protein